jgi:hypothetical protein
LIMFSLSILWPFAQGRGHSDHQNDRFPSYEVVVCWLVLNVAQSPMQNSTHTRLRMLACGCLLLTTEFLEKPLILHPWQTLSFTTFCVHTRRGSPHLFLIIHYLQFHPLFISDSTSLWWNPAKLLYQKNTHPPKLFSIVDFLDPCLFSSFH